MSSIGEVRSCMRLCAHTDTAKPDNLDSHATAQRSAFVPNLMGRRGGVQTGN
jgi:hypothetical protein